MGAYLAHQFVVEDPLEIHLHFFLELASAANRMEEHDP